MKTKGYQFNTATYNSMAKSTEHSAYPHPEEFQVMRPEYTELEDGYFQATISVSPFRVTGRSVTEAGARRAALYEAEKTYRSYHPGYKVDNPYPESFVDREGTQWTRTSEMQRSKVGDYSFTNADGDEEDYADIESMLMWDVRPAKTTEAA